MKLHALIAVLLLTGVSPVFATEGPGNPTDSTGHGRAEFTTDAHSMMAGGAAGGIGGEKSGHAQLKTDDQRPIVLAGGRVSGGGDISHGA